MDDIVKQAIAKWPNVPHCIGWLGLDARGRWWLRDDAAQAAGPFPASRGTLLDHARLIGFIERNYLAADDGCWFFQNGPQRVFVELESTPLIWRIEVDGALRSHHGLAATSVDDCLVDEHGHLYLATDLGLGRVHTLDMALAADAIERGDWTPQDVAASALPKRFGFCISPAELHRDAI